MPVKLEGSCQCGSVSFSVESNTPFPYQLCYCSICRKTAGGGGYAINIMGIFSTLTIQDKTTMGVHQAVIGKKRNKDVVSEGERNFCTKCGTCLWLWDKRWPELVHPFASVIDTDLPVPPTRTHLMLSSKASWVIPDIKEGDQTFQEYPVESIEEWHRKRNLWVE